MIHDYTLPFKNVIVLLIILFWSSHAGFSQQVQTNVSWVMGLDGLSSIFLMGLFCVWFPTMSYELSMPGKGWHYIQKDRTIHQEPKIASTTHLFHGRNRRSIVMDNIAPAIVDPTELPAGFTSADPNAAAAQGGGSASTATGEAQQKEEQKQAVLQQALTADALARLRRIKVRTIFIFFWSSSAFVSLLWVGL